MGTPPALRALPTAADAEDPTVVFWGKELRMGPGRVTTTGEGWITTVKGTNTIQELDQTFPEYSKVAREYMGSKMIFLLQSTLKTGLSLHFL